MTTNAFDKSAQVYDQWFETHAFAYDSELIAARECLPGSGLGIEIGVGTGRFSSPLSIPIGVEPSESMAAIARSRGIAVHVARAEALPFESGHFDFALMITTLCFVENPLVALSEAYRILKPNGILILGIIDRETKLGRAYESRKRSSAFYRDATFYSTAQALALLRRARFDVTDIRQTIFSNPDTMNAVDPVLDGYGKGAFVVIRSTTIPQE